MSKIICDVCGTRYPDSSEQCPICGRVRATAADAAENVADEVMESSPRSSVRGGRFSKANVRKRNQNQPQYEEQIERPRSRVKPQEEETYNEYEGYEEETAEKSSKALNIALVVVIIALLAVSAYIFVEFFMPNVMSDRLSAETEPTATEIQTVPVTEEPTVPCSELVLDVAEVVLEQPEQMYLLNVQVLPADTTDELVFISSDENVATVNAEGRVTAVGSGRATVTISCGILSIECDITCDFGEEETEAPTEAAEETEPTEEPTEAPTEAPAENLKDVTLSVHKDNLDVTFRMIGQASTFRLTCDLENTEVTWISENENIAKVDEKGVVTCVGWGRTNVIVKYGDQEVTCIIRCVK